MPEPQNSWRQNIAVSAIALSSFAVAWELLARTEWISASLLPAPSAIIVCTARDFSYLIFHAIVTVAEAFGGLAIAILVAGAFAVAMLAGGKIAAALRPFLLITQVVPKLAIAPIIAIWVGIDSPSKMLVATSIAFFPLLEAIIAGLSSTDDRDLQLFHSWSASRAQTLIYLRIPMAAPHLITGLKLAAIYSFVGAIGAELIYAKRGLGYVITLADGNANSPLLFAAVCFAGIAGFLTWGALLVIERIISKRLRFPRTAIDHVYGI